jgi:hypothetical protein
MSHDCLQKQLSISHDDKSIVMNQKLQSTPRRYSCECPSHIATLIPFSVGTSATDILVPYIYGIDSRPLAELLPHQMGSSIKIGTQWQ